ncbi:MAG: NAD(P)H-dependent oxidoreductase [Oscillospiraceae bacterium]|jgi:multimeric flavodoxin WrbA|nr:NAD(P)H-dependent oxidoreductase [Oscillospiraceae bacterium]
MKIVSLNGSPRTAWNTAQMLDSAADGARSVGAEVSSYDLYALDFKGCSSCFACKRLGGASYGKCGMRDALTPILDELWQSDGLVIGAPVYFGDVTACVRAFLERLWFAGLAYSRDRMVLNPKRIPVRIILTTNAPLPNFHKSLNESTVTTMERFVGPTEIIEANDTLQFDDYAKYETSMFDVGAKLKRREEQFPNDLKNAFELGVKLANDN